MERYTVMLPAAGSGTRMGAGYNKLFLELSNMPILAHTLRIFERDDRCEAMILAIKKEERSEIERVLEEYNITKVQTFVEGGKERQHSVHACLEAYNGAPESIVLVHDAARPFLRQSTIHSLVMKAKEIGGAIAAVRVKDTTKRGRDGLVTETLQRDTLWTIQTPQAFQYNILYEASKRALKEQFAATDESMLVEYVGKDVALVESTYDNIKMTTPEDLAFGEIILRRKGEQR